MVIENKDRLFYLDFIRALSVLSIVIFHFNCSISQRSIGTTKIFFDTYPNGCLGTIGVSLFFIISGAALMHTYQNQFRIKTYIKKRFLSIYPMFWTAYAFVFLYYFYKYYTTNPFSPHVPKWTFILSVLGVDGYLVALIPNYYILGEWFLGCIILIYFCFPILRSLMIKFPKTLAICAIIIYITVIQKYAFRIQLDFNILVRVPEVLFGMYFVRYIRKINIYQFISSLLVVVVMFLKPLDIHYMYKITITGISLFIVLAYIGQRINTDNVKKPFLVTSKYSFAVFLIHHVIIEQLLVRFTQKYITPIETYLLFIVVCIFISIMSNLLIKTTDKIIYYVKEFNKNNLLLHNYNLKNERR